MNGMGLKTCHLVIGILLAFEITIGATQNVTSTAETNVTSIVEMNVTGEYHTRLLSGLLRPRIFV